MENKIKVLIVEDEVLIADEIGRTLEGLGYEVAGLCYDYPTAEAEIGTTDADLILLDINLGSGEAENGIALAKGIRAGAAPKPFIFLTAYSDTDTIAKATALQPANYLIKPINPAALFAAIQLAINRAQTEAGTTVEQEAATTEAGVSHFFYVKTGKRTQKLYWEEVYCLEARKNYVLLFAKGLLGSYPVRGSILFVLEQLVPESLRAQFVRLGRNRLLNKSHITRLTDATIDCGGETFENAGRISEV